MVSQMKLEATEMVLQKDAGNTMDQTCKEWKSFKEEKKKDIYLTQGKEVWKIILARQIETVTKEKQPRVEQDLGEIRDKIH